MQACARLTSVSPLAVSVSKRPAPRVTAASLDATLRLLTLEWDLNTNRLGPACATIFAQRFLLGSPTPSGEKVRSTVRLYIMRNRRSGENTI